MESVSATFLIYTGHYTGAQTGTKPGIGTRTFMKIVKQYLRVTCKEKSIVILFLSQKSEIYVVVGGSKKMRDYHTKLGRYMSLIPSVIVFSLN